MEPIPADGSPRHFSRLISAAGDALAVVMVNPPSTPMAERENLAYLNIGRHLSEKGLCVPEIHGYHLESGWFIMEDLGNRHLQDVVLSQTDPLTIYRDVLEQLVSLQVRGAEDFDLSWCCQTEVYDLIVMRRYESDYFRDAFLRGYLGLNDTGSELESAFVHLAENASKADCRFFLHRDFQSRNILISGRKIGFVDWQGGRMGPLAYDLASLLIDPYAGLSEQQRDSLFYTYVQRVRDVNPDWAESVEVGYPYLSIQRNLQVLGAFSYLTNTMQKARFETYIPQAVRSLDQQLDRTPDPALAPLRDVVKTIRARIGEPTHPSSQGTPPCRTG